MAGKVKTIRLAAIILIVGTLVTLSAMIQINPLSDKVIQLKPQGAVTLAMTPAFSSPRNVQMVSVLGSGAETDSLVITWDKVPGARGYHIYSCVVQPDSTQWVNKTEMVYIEGTPEYVYRYSYHPKYGDPYMFKTQNEALLPYPKMWDRAVATPWARDSSGVLSGCRYSIVTEEDMALGKRYYVTAWR